MLPIERGLEIVLTTAKSKDRPDWMPAESVPLIECISRVLREDVFADSDSPPFDKAIRDGFAVRSDDVMEIPAILSVIGESRAGLGIECSRPERPVLRDHDRRATSFRRQCCGHDRKYRKALAEFSSNLQIRSRE